MSIIYDALKKVEQSQGSSLQTKIDKPDKPGPKVYVTYVLIVLMGIIVASIFWGLFIKPPLATDVASNVDAASKVILLPNKPIPETTPPLQPPAVVKSEPRTTFTLNGIFFSQNEGFALINNQIVKEGDNIGSAKVLLIRLDEVELESDGSLIKLSVK